MRGPRSPAGCRQSAAAPHTTQSFQVREEHTLAVLRRSVARQEIPVTAAHIPDPYFIYVNSYYVAGSHTRTDFSWRNLSCIPVLGICTSMS